MWPFPTSAFGRCAMPIGPTELIIVLVIIVIVFGAGRLPEVGGALGKGIKEFRKATSEEETPKENTEKRS